MASVVLKPGVNGVAPMGAAASSDALTAKVTSIVQGIFKKIKLLAIFCGVGCLALVGLYFTVHYPVRVVMTAISVGVLYKAIAPSLTMRDKTKASSAAKTDEGGEVRAQASTELAEIKEKNHQLKGQLNDMKPLLAKAIATFIGKRKEFQASSISAKNDVNDINAILNNIKRLQNEVKSPSAAKKTESFLQDAKIKYAELEEKMGRRKVLMDFLKVIESAVNALNQVNKTPPLNTHDKTAQLRVENLHLEASMGILKSLIDALNVYNHSVKALQHPSASEKTPSSDGPKRKKQVRQ